MVQRTSKLAFFVGAVLLSSASAHAQTTTGASDPQDTAAGMANEIVVTAQRREERLQDVPIAVSAFSAEDLAERQITNTLDLVNYVPNLIGHNNTSVGTANAYAMRGLSNTESISTFDPPIGSYVDGIYIARQGANNFSFFDVERIEVLRGPQGTLFGKNTTGGAINVVMRKPSDEFTGFMEAGYGRYDRVQLRGSVDLPISADVLTKVSAYYISADGYVDNLTTGEKLNGEESYGFRGAVRAYLTPDVTWDVSAEYVNSSNNNLPHFYDAENDRRISFTPLRTDEAIGADLVSEELADNTLGNTAESYALASDFEVTLGSNATLNFITGYRHLYQEFLTDSFAGVSSSSLVLDGINYVSSSRGFSTPLANDSWHKQFSQEIKVTGSAFGGFVDYVAGVFYFNETNETNFVNSLLPLSGRANATRSADRTVFNDIEDFAGYAQGDFHLTPALTFTAGIRYTDETKDVAYTPNDSPLPAGNPLYVPFSTQDLIDAGIPVEQKSKEWTPRFALQYEFNPDLNVYASATRGFKAGGWNARAYYATGIQPFSQETIWSYEAGVRSEWFDRMLRVNLTGFYFMDYDQQLPGGGLDPTTGTITYLTRNVADLENYGLEAEVTVSPVRNLNIYWSAGLQHATYKNVNAGTLAQQQDCLNGVAGSCNNSIVTPDGEIADPTRAPDFTSTLGFNYTAELGSGYSITPSVNWRYVSDTWVSTSNDMRGFQEGYSIFNAGLTFRMPSNVSLTLECSNCFDEVYRTSFLIYPYLNQPGSWMARARYDF
ncbi:TonB-dependent receptor [Stakelama tenebrarum]|uniref:TonB-dependent receptor n=1 Tax=Stakelama tenebrarum TaxID=2711215 RepID=A0A6G6Y2R2_9SPHN|nr:TonB-dependent receptor [Sphingosinithalassobacter tenebrarum]QIG78856.1 TonB-dependent receptor [Sphingosinithalassobacter tenebrarum]